MNDMNEIKTHARISNVRIYIETISWLRAIDSEDDSQPKLVFSTWKMLPFRFNHT